MSDNELLTGMIIYLLLSKIDRREQSGKRGRKAISKSLKKTLIQYGVKNEEKYLGLVEDTDIIMKKAEEVVGTEGVSINPGTLIFAIQKKYPGNIEVFGLKETHVLDLEKAYKDSANGYATLKVANRVIEQIDAYTGIKSVGAISV